MSILRSTALLAALAASVSAHGYVDGIIVDGTWHDGTSPNWVYGEKPDTPGWYAKNQDNGFVAPSSFGGGDIICHKEATVGGSPITVAAGSKIDLSWNTWPESHHGPVIDYLAPVSGDFSSVDKTALEFFKFNEGGLVDGSSAPGKWASDDLIANNNTWTTTIPSSIAPGNYVLRHEIIALHSAGQADGAQNYPQCINIKVTGSGTDSPSGTVGTSLYKEDDAGILINIYTALGDSYKIPGPALYGSGSSGSGSGSSGSQTGAASSAAPAATTSAAAAPASTAAPSSSPISYGGSLSAPYANSSTPATSYAAPTTTSAAAETTAYTTVEQTTAVATATAAASSSDVSVAPAAPSETPSSTAAAAEPTGSTPSYGSNDEPAWGDMPSKPLPAGYTLKDLEMWVAYLTKPSWNKGVHARDFKRFVA